MGVRGSTEWAKQYASEQHLDGRDAAGRAATPAAAGAATEAGGAPRSGEVAVE